VKKYISLLLVLFLILNAGGYVFIYIEMSYYFKKIAFEKINNFIQEDELSILKFKKNELNNNSSFRWIDEKEFLFEDSYYDIYKIIEEDEYVYFYCLCDENENILGKAFVKFINNISSSDVFYSCLKNFIKNIITVAQAPVYETNNFYFKTIIYNILLVTNYNSIGLEVPTPPPKS